MSIFEFRAFVNESRDSSIPSIRDLVSHLAVTKEAAVLSLFVFTVLLLVAVVVDAVVRVDWETNFVGKV